MEWVLVALVLLVAVVLWAMVKMMELALAWKMVEQAQETQTDLDLQALMENWKEKE